MVLGSVLALLTYPRAIEPPPEMGVALAGVTLVHLPVLHLVAPFMLVIGIGAVAWTRGDRTAALGAATVGLGGVLLVVLRFGDTLSAFGDAGIAGAGGVGPAHLVIAGGIAMLALARVAQHVRRLLLVSAAALAVYAALVMPTHSASSFELVVVVLAAHGTAFVSAVVRLEDARHPAPLGRPSPIGVVETA
jgi:hypothetical protein